MVHERGRERWFTYFKLCVFAGEGGGGVERGGAGHWESIHLFQTALKNLANKYFYFGQFLILSSEV